MEMFRIFILFLFTIGLTFASVSNNDITSESSEENNVDRNQNKKPPKVGGAMTLDLTNLDNLQKVQQLTDFSVKSINAKSNDLYHHSRIRILGASRQLVAGLKYNITFTMGQTECAKNRVSFT